MTNPFSPVTHPVEHDAHERRVAAEIEAMFEGIEPIPFGRTASLPRFPVEVFPPWLGDMVTATAHFTQTDPGMPGTVALSVLAACAGGRLEVEARPGWREPTNLFVAVVARPGERKSPVQVALTSPLRTAELAMVNKTATLIAEAEAQRDIAEKAAEKTRSAAARATGPERDKLTAEAVAASVAAEAITVPTLPRLLADDTTPEALASLMANNAGKIALISDEGGIFDTLGGRYSAVPNLDPFLKGHAGTPMRVDRKARAAEYIQKPALTLALMVQPAVLRQVGGNEVFRGRGLLARFLFVLPTSLVGKRLVDPDPVPPEVTERYSTTIQELAKTLAEWNDPAVIALTPQARKVMFEAAQHIEDRLGTGGSLDHIADWANKLVGATVRIAGLLHVAHRPEDCWRAPVDAPVMTDAVRLSRFLTAHYRAAIEAMGADPKVEAARYLLGIVERIGQKTVTSRDLFNRVSKTWFPKVGDMLVALELLEEHGWVVRLPEPERTGPGRRPAPTFAIHPAISADSAEP